MRGLPRLVETDDTSRRCRRNRANFHPPLLLSDTRLRREKRGELSPRNLKARSLRRRHHGTQFVPSRWIWVDGELQDLYDGWRFFRQLGFGGDLYSRRFAHDELSSKAHTMGGAQWLCQRIQRRNRNETKRGTQAWCLVSMTGLVSWPEGGPV